MMNEPKPKRTLFRDTRGAIIAEGVIVLPVFVTTLAAIVFFHNVYATKLDQSTKARSCAWSYAVNGCGELPPNCPMARVDGFEAIENSVSTEAIGKARSDSNGALEKMNDLGLALMGLDEGVTSRPGADVKRPSILGGGTTRIFGDYTVMCNEQNTTVAKIAGNAYCALGDKIDRITFPGCSK